MAFDTGTYTFPNAATSQGYPFLWTDPVGTGLQSSSTNRRWSWDSNDTPSTGMGPTSGQGGSPEGYIYTEASSPGAFNDQFFMEFNGNVGNGAGVLDCSANEVVVTYYTNQRGDNNNATCDLEVNEDGGGWVSVLQTGGSGDPNKVGTSGTDVWVLRTVNLTDEGVTNANTRLRWRIQFPSSGTSWHNDYGLDTIRIQGTDLAGINSVDSDYGDDSDEFDLNENSLDINGLAFEASQGSGEVWLAEASTLAGSSNEVEITNAVQTWSDTLINLDLTDLTTEHAGLESLVDGDGHDLHIIVVNDSSDEYSRPVTVHRAKAFTLSASDNIAPGGANTTAQLTPPSGKTTGDFDGGRIQDDENPADTVDIGNNGYGEWEWAIEAVDPTDGTYLGAQDGEVYQFRVLFEDLPLASYTATPTWEVSGVVNINAVAVTGTGSVPDPTFSTSTGTTTSAVAATASLPTPSITAGTGDTITADSVFGTTTILPAIPVTGTLIAAVSVVGMSSASAPVVGSGSTLTASTVTGSSSVAQPTSIAHTTTVAEVALTNQNDPGIDTNHTIGIVARVVGGLGSNIDVTLVQGTTVIASFNTGALTATFTEFTYDLTTPEAAAITDYSDLRIRWKGIGTNANGTQVEAVWLQAPDGGQTGDANLPVDSVVGIGFVPDPGVTAQVSATIIPLVVVGAVFVPDVGIATAATITPTVVETVAVVPLHLVTSDAQPNAPPVGATSSVPTPSITTGVGTTITPTAVTGTATVLAPSVGVETTIFPTAVNTPNPGIPAVIVITQTRIQPGVVTGTSFIPAIGIASDTTIAPVVVAASSAVPQPTLTGTATITPVAVVGTATVVQPSVTAGGGVSLSPTSVAGTTTIPEPVLPALPVIVTGDAVIPTPTVTTGADTATTAVLGAAFIPSPVLTAGADIAPLSVAAAASVPTSVVAADLFPVVAAVQVDATVPQPTLAASTIIPTTAIAVPATIPSPSAASGSGVTIAPSAVIATTWVGAPSLPVFPVSVTGVSSILSPTIGAGAGIAPTSVAGAAFVPQPSVQAGGGLALNPSSIAGTAVIPAPDASGNSPATITPSVVVTSSTVPQPTVASNAEIAPSSVVGSGLFPSFHPDQLDNRFGWYDYTDMAAGFEGQAILAVTDRWGGFAPDSFHGSSPAWKLSEINGLNVADFSADLDLFHGATDTETGQSPSLPVTVWAVAYLPSDPPYPTFQHWLLDIGTGNSAKGLGIVVRQSGEWALSVDGTYAGTQVRIPPNSMDFAYASAGWYVIVATFEGKGSTYAWINGEQGRVIDLSTPTTPENVQIGNKYNPRAYGWPGFIAEVGYVDDLLTESEIDGLNGYLSAKYGIDTGVTPSPVVTCSATITPAPVAATSSIPTPVVTGGTGTSIAPVAVATTTIIGTPTLPAFPVVVGVTSSIPTPLVGTGGGILVFSVVGTSTVPQPTLTTSAVITPTTVVATSTVPQPGVEATTVISSTAVTGDAAVPQPVITTSAVVTPAVVGGVTTVLSPAIQVGGGVSLAPSSVAGTSTIPQPAVDVTAAVVVTPTVVVGTSTVPTPTITTGADIAPSVVASTATIPAPSILAGASLTITPSSVTGVAAIPSATVSAQTRIIVTPVAGTSTVPVPTFTHGADIVPSSVTGSVSVPTPTVVAGSSVGLPVSPVVGSSFVPDPTLTGSPVVAPPTVGLTATITDPQITIDVVITPDAVTGVAVIDAIGIDVGYRIKGITALRDLIRLTRGLIRLLQSVKQTETLTTRQKTMTARSTKGSGTLRSKKPYDKSVE